MADFIIESSSQTLPRSIDLADQVEDILLNLIRGRGFKEGEPLPKEEELAEQLHVSRHIVREGLSRLKALGLIESRKRRGIVLTRPNVFSPMEKLVQAQVFTLKEQREFMAMRCVMELGMVDFIYRKKSSEIIAKLRQLATNDAKFMRHPELEAAFHGLLFSIGGNEIASQFQTLLARLFSPESLRLPTRPPQLITHMEICDALESGTLEEFRDTMFKHMAYYVED